jgi:hypothetical protein
MSAVEALRIITLNKPKTSKGRILTFHAYSVPIDEWVIAPAKGERKTSNILVVIKAVKGKGANQ